MPTKSQLETMVKEYESTIRSLRADRGVFHTELGKLAIIHNFQPLLDFLNFTPEEEYQIRDMLI